MTQGDFKHIKELGQTLEVKPPNGAWDKLENKLIENQKFSKKKKYNFVRFWLSIAASTMVIITCACIIYFEVTEAQVAVPGHIAEWEELNITNDYFYSLELVRKAPEINRQYKESKSFSNLILSE